jgi:hypothetical protein
MIARSKKFHLIAAALLAATLAACGASDDKMGRMLVAPDKFVLYGCPAIAEKAAFNAVREQELQALMTKAGTGSDGRLVSAVAYRPEYLELRGEDNELRAAAIAKNCSPLPAETPQGRVSDTIVR